MTKNKTYLPIIILNLLWLNFSRLYVIVGKMIKHQITSCSHVHSTTEKGNTSGLLVPQWMPSFGALQMIYTWQHILRH